MKEFIVGLVTGMVIGWIIAIYQIAHKPKEEKIKND